MQVSKKALIFGVDSFTGSYLKKSFEKKGIEVIGTTFSQKNTPSYCDITNYPECAQFLQSIFPDYVVNLCGISFVPHIDYSQIYDVNFNGAINVLKACEEHVPNCKLLLVSSGQIYASTNDAIKETNELKLSNHYAVSKHSMELVAKLSSLDVKIARSFNYTGVGQDSKFLIPKIVNHYKDTQSSITLGDIDVYRDFSDVRDVTDAYLSILFSESNEQIFNVCSNTTYSIADILSFLNQECGYEMNVKQSSEFMRSDIARTVKGHNGRLRALGWEENYSLFNTLKWMLDA